MATPVGSATAVSGVNVVALDPAAQIEGEGQKRMDTPLHAAARRGNVDVIHALLGAGAEVDEELKGIDDGHSVRNQGLTPLVEAVWAGKKEAALALLEAGASIDVCPEGKALIFYAVESGDPEVVIELISRGVSIHAIHEEKPLVCVAARQGDVELMRILLEKDASLVNSKTEEGDTPLHIAASRLNPELVRLLLVYSADLFAPNKKGNTPLHHAASVDTPRDETQKEAVLQELVSVLGPVEVQEKNEGLAESSQTAGLIAEDSDRKTALDLAMDKYKRGGEHPCSLLALPEFFVKSPEHYAEGNTPLHYASIVGAQAIERVLAACPELLNQPNDAGETPLVAAVKAGEKESIECLLQQPTIDLDFSNLEGYSALHIAAARGNAWLVERLLEAGANPLLVTTYGTPMKAVLQRGYGSAFQGYVDVVRVLLENGVPPSSQAELDYIIEKGLLPKTIHEVINSGYHLVFIHYLLGEELHGHQIDVPHEIDTSDKRGWTYLHLAVAKGRGDVVKYLLGRGDIDVNARTNKDFTPLDFAEMVHAEGLIAQLHDAGGVKGGGVRPAPMPEGYESESVVTVHDLPNETWGAEILPRLKERELANVARVNRGLRECASAEARLRQQRIAKKSGSSALR